MTAKKKNVKKAPVKKTVGRKHSVKAFLQIHELTKAGTSIRFEIFARDEKIGEIVIGRGSFTWYGKKRRTGKELSWSSFAQLMDGQFY